MILLLTRLLWWIVFPLLVLETLVASLIVWVLLECGVNFYDIPYQLIECIDLPPFPMPEPIECVKEVQCKCGAWVNADGHSFGDYCSDNMTLLNELRPADEVIEHPMDKLVVDGTTFKTAVFFNGVIAYAATTAPLLPFMYGAATSIAAAKYDLYLQLKAWMDNIKQAEAEAGTE